MTDYRVYKDSDTGLYVAEHPDLPVSSCGETEENAIANARDAVRQYEEPDGEATPDFNLERVTDAEDVQEIIEDNDESEDKQVYTIVADSIGDPRYCPECSSKLDIEWDEDERGDRKCPECENRYMEYNIEYLKEVLEPHSREELLEKTEEIEILKNDSIEPDEDIDVYHTEASLRMERMSDKSVFVAGYNGGENNNIDYRYHFTCVEDGLKISREIVRDD